jgi:hypothetical protein
MLRRLLLAPRQTQRPCATFTILQDPGRFRATLSSGPKTSPRQVAEKTIQGIRSGIEHVVADDNATSLWQATRQDLIKKHADMQALRDQHVAATRVQL